MLPIVTSMFYMKLTNFTECEVRLTSTWLVLFASYLLELGNIYKQQ